MVSFQGWKSCSLCFLSCMKMGAFKNSFGRKPDSTPASYYTAVLRGVIWVSALQKICFLIVWMYFCVLCPCWASPRGPEVKFCGLRGAGLSCSIRSDSATPWAAAHQATLCMGFSRTLEWVATPSSRGSSQPRDQTKVSCIARGFFTI